MERISRISAGRRVSSRGMRLVGSLAVLALAASACSSNSSAGSSSSAAVSSDQAKQAYQMTLITGDNHDPFFVSMNAGAQAEAKRLGVNVDWQGPAQYQANLQIPIVSAVLASKPDFVFISPVDAQALGAPIGELSKAGIPVMTLDSDVNDTSVRLGNVTSDNALGGKQAADALAKLIGGKGEVAVLNEQPGVTTTDLRQKGFEDQIATYPDITYVGVGRDNDDATVAATTASALLTRYPNLKGFFATDTANGAGAATAVQQSGRDVSVVAFDAEPEEVTGLKTGTLDTLIVQKAYDFGVKAVQDAVKYLDGDKSAIAPSTLMDYVIATKDNVDSPDVKKYLYQEK